MVAADSLGENAVIHKRPNAGINEIDWLQNGDRKYDHFSNRVYVL